MDLLIWMAFTMEKRHNIKYKSVCGENASVDQSVCEDRKQSILTVPVLCVMMLKTYSMLVRQACSGDYYQIKHMQYVDKLVLVERKAKKELLCLSVQTWSAQKMPLLAIGKLKSPRCFHNILHLPTEYDANKSAWMTSSKFESWLRKWDNELSRQGRKIALFIDNSTMHPKVQDLQCIQLVFLPPNTTSKIQPCDQGIINALKANYRKNMVNQLIQAMDNMDK